MTDAARVLFLGCAAGVDAVVALAGLLRRSWGFGALFGALVTRSVVCARLPFWRATR
jgi:hypothetical protein